MRLISFDRGRGPEVGVGDGDEVRPVPGLTLAGVLGVLDAGDGARLVRAAGAGVPLAEVRLLPPVPRPPKIVCVGINYAGHAAETGATLPDYPVLFARFATSLVAHGQPLLVPSASTQLDYEGELAVVIGRPGRNIERSRALEHVAGYSVFDDASVRDYQRRTSQFTPGKNFDGTGGFGPALVTADDLPPGARGLRLTTTVDGEVRQDDTTDHLVFDVADLVHLISSVMTLEVGDVIATGTPEGVAAARTPPPWLRPGDTVEVTIEGIGTLRNPVLAGP